MPIENQTHDIDLELASALKQAYAEAQEMGFGGSYNDFVSAMSVEALRSMLSKGGRVSLEEGGKPFDPVADWIKLIKTRAQLSPQELRMIDDLVVRMLEPKDEDKNE